jgi:hypothetical protein
VDHGAPEFRSETVPNEDDAPKKDTKRKARPDAAGDAPAEKPKTKKVTKDQVAAASPPEGEKTGAEKPAGEKTKTKKVTKEQVAAAAEGGDAKTKTGKRPRPDGDKAEKPEGDAPAAEGEKSDKPKKKRTGERPKPAGPPPAVKGAPDYALAVLGPVVGVAGGLVAFLFLKKGLDHAASPVLGFTNAADVSQALSAGFVVAFPPIPIIVGLLVGLLVTFESLKMAAGTATRIMSVLTLMFTICAVAPFILDARNLNGFLEAELKKHYKTPRGGEPDVRALELKLPADEFAMRQLRATFKIDLDEGDISPAWVAETKDMVSDPKADEKLENENEKKIHCADLRIALQACRDLMGKFKAEVEPIQAKLFTLRDAAAEANTSDLADGWAKFEGKVRRDLAKPPKPKGAGEWFTKFDTWGDMGIQDPTKRDLPYNRKWYLGKAIHAACKDLPPEMKYAGVFQVEVPLDYVAKNDAEKLVTKFDFAWVCYDLEKLDRDPVVLPHVKGFTDDQRFKIEVLGEK